MKSKIFTVLAVMLFAFAAMVPAQALALDFVADQGTAHLPETAIEHADEASHSADDVETPEEAETPDLSDIPDSLTPDGPLSIVETTPVDGKATAAKAKALRG